ncbi:MULTISPECIES: nucleoside deaminase [Halolamina]|uniref:tRNA(Arg) A34 adenosine deaminase TadA n=1 Tax=Halolamina pelagica TaxID=699431 RepID=A0A1I5RNS1_9EURY|nr:MULTISPECIES: nucleoside deaminase [Halolamina]NHX35254.1 nucleoside deaminase [Halolamina sp. R1-12]SFP59556.1 tRNA(Arg) A34 adenosine deaminase TadA [Halolamina pelagica]
MDLDAFDHESHMREALDCAREAAARGDEPFGSVLVKDDEVVLTAGNRINSENDLRAHPELTLAKRAAAERDDADELVMYTSTEPCPMCAGGIDIAGLRAVVYSVSGERAAELHGTDPLLSSTAVFEAGRSDVRVIPDVLKAEGEKLHDAHR